MSRDIKVIKPINVTKDESGVVGIKKKRVAAYARVSTDYEDQINSYKVQCEEYTNVINSNPNYIFSGIFADQGLSGTQAKKRPEFMKMIAKAKAGDLDLILTKSISRFARNVVDTITTVRELRELGVEIYFEKENISSLDPKIDFMLTILSSIAQEESRSISSNVKWAYDKKFKNGVVDARRIYGYDVVDGKFVINESEAEIINKIFKLTLKRYKPSDIAKTLNSEGIKTIKGNPWTYGTIRHILQNERYCGDALLRKTVCIDYLTKKTVKNNNIADKYYVSNNHEPIVSKEMFDSVQLILKDTSSQSRNNNKESKYPLTGMIICPKCGRSLKRQQVNRGKNMRVVFNCNHYYGNELLCNSSNPDYNLIIEATMDSIKEIFSNNNVLNNLFIVFNNNVALNTLRSDLKALKDENNHLINLHHENPEDAHIFNQIEHNDTKISALEQEVLLGVSSSVRLDYIKSLVKSELENDSDLNIRDIYSLVIADAQKVIFVISPTKTRDELISKYKDVLDVESILSKSFVNKSGTANVFYEVKLYE